MNTHRFILEPYKTPASRFICPECGHKRCFSRYIDLHTGEYIANHVGRCNREHNCGYHYTPKQYFSDNGIKVSDPQTQPFISKPEPIKPLSLFPETIFRETLKYYQENNLIAFLLSIFNLEIITNLLEKYLIGTSKHWSGASIFWQIDITRKVRSGKVMLFDARNGHRIKNPFNHITWAHSILKLEDYNLEQCFFGEHLLPFYPDLPVSIVESEKTALIASVYFPQFVWIATGGIYGCRWTSRKVCNALSGRKVLLWPDANAFDKWNKALQVLQGYGLRVSISDLLEKQTSQTEKAAGVDIADYLLNSFPNQFNQENDRHPP